MSATQTFAFCIDCWELHYGIPDSNGVFDRDSPSSNHWYPLAYPNRWDHKVLGALIRVREACS